MTLTVLPNLLFELLVILADLLLLLFVVVLSLNLLLLEGDDFIIKLKLAMNKLKELSAGEEDGSVESLGHEVTSPVFRGECFSALLIDVLLAIDLTLAVVDIDVTLVDVLLTLE